MKPNGTKETETRMTGQRKHRCTCYKEENAPIIKDYSCSKANGDSRLCSFHPLWLLRLQGSKCLLSWPRCLWGEECPLRWYLVRQTLSIWLGCFPEVMHLQRPEHGCGSTGDPKQERCWNPTWPFALVLTSSLQGRDLTCH